jgi:hypothetical protein
MDDTADAQTEHFNLIADAGVFYLRRGWGFVLRKAGGVVAVLDGVGVTGLSAGAAGGLAGGFHERFSFIG